MLYFQIVKDDPFLLAISIGAVCIVLKILSGIVLFHVRCSLWKETSEYSYVIRDGKLYTYNWVFPVTLAKIKFVHSTRHPRNRNKYLIYVHMQGFRLARMFGIGGRNVEKTLMKLSQELKRHHIKYEEMP